MRTVHTTGDHLDLVFFDGNENVCTRLRLPRTAAVERTDSEEHPIAVDQCAVVRTPWMEVDGVPAVTVYDEAGDVVATDPDREPLVLTPAVYRVELSTPVQLLLVVDGGLRIRTGEDRVRVHIDGERAVQVGARFPTERPQATVRTTIDVPAVFEAVSTFGAAIRWHGPERSYPTMRAHPPRLEVGDNVEIPADVRPPETGFELQVPGTLLNAAIAAPLAYYLGARLTPSRTPQLLFEGEALASMRSGVGLAADCADLLHRTLLLDCLTRTAPDFDVPIAERRRLSDRLDVEWSDLAELSGGARIRAYLDLPTADLRAVLPRWSRRAYVVPNARTIETLPFLAYELVTVLPYRGIPRGQPEVGPAVTDGGVDPTLRRPATRPSPGRRGPGRRWRSLLDLGTRRPIGVNRAFPAAFDHRLSRPDRDESVSVAVVCNDGQMAEELEIAGDTYRSREGFPVDVERHENLRRDELAALMGEPIDYFHYIGHIDAGGFDCADGSLDAGGVERVGVEAFFLNACDSVEQAIALVEAGGVGGIATKHAIVNSGAVALGETIAALLIKGFPIGVALGFASSHNVIGHKYAIVGDPTLDIANTESGVPYRCEVTRCEGGQFELTIRTYLSAAGPHGSVSAFRLREDTPYYLNPTERTFTVGRAELLAFLDLEVVPVTMDGELLWSPAVRERLGTDAAVSG